MSKEKRVIKAEDLYKFKLISECEISPDGNSVVFCVQRVDSVSEKKYADLWISSTEKRESSRFTTGDYTDRFPRWSPDGRKIAFISNRDNEEQEQIYIIPFQGGEAEKLTDFKGDIRDFEWSPDGGKLVCTFRKQDKAEREREEDKNKKELGVTCRRITRAFYKEDSSGYKPDERWHLWTLDVNSGKANQITDHEIYDEYEPSWSPDGREIVFLSVRTEHPDLSPDAVDIFKITSEGEKITKIHTPPGPKSRPIFSPDGRWLAYYGKKGRGKWWKLNSLWIVPSDNSGKSKNLTEEYDIQTGFSTINDLIGGKFQNKPVWSEDSSRIYFQVSKNGNTELFSIKIESEDPPEPIIKGKGVVGKYSLDKSGNKISYFHGNLTDPGQIFIKNTDSSKSNRVTDINTEILNEINFGEIEELWFKGEDGYDLQGWIIKPPDFNENKKYPSVLEIHGGPRVQYGNFIMHEFFYLASKDYVVYFCNPRGGQGYGEKHSKSIWNEWGSVDYRDLISFANLMEEKPYIDSKKMGVTGGSYGGYMTNWIIGHTEIFSAAVTQRSVSNLISMWGSSDFNWVFQQEFGGKPPWENFENYWEQSPIKYMGNVKTPTMVIHSENDLRCALEQGEQVFISLKKKGVDTELIIFPEESHGLSRTGRTDRRIERLNHILRWFDKYLKDQ